MKKELENVLILSRSEEHARMIIDFWEKQGLKENWIPQQFCYYGLYHNAPLFASQSLIAGNDAKYISLEEAETIAKKYDVIGISDNSSAYALCIQNSSNEKLMTINANGDIHIRGAFVKNDKEIADIINQYK